MDINEKMHNKKLYVGEVMEEQLQCVNKLYDFNMTRPTEMLKRKQLLQEMFAEFGEGSYIEPPLHANWGGKHVHFGKNVYANFNLTLVDDTHIYIGDNTMLAPNVVISTGTHPICPELREKAYQFNVEIHIGKNVWIGANSVILPGITIGDNSVIGAGSVVTKDIPANVVAFGNPCTVRRNISEKDKEYYFKNLKIKDNI